MWVRIDDQFPDHPKIVDVGVVAAWLHVAAMCYCSRYLTDGRLSINAARARVSDSQVRELTGKPVDDLIERLVAAGLWERVDGGFVIHDWHAYQPSAGNVKAKRDELSQKRAEAGRRGAEARWQNDSKTMANLPANASQTDSPVPVPVPVPVPDPKPEEDRENHDRSTSRKSSQSADVDKVWEPEINRLATLLADRIEQNTRRRPRVTTAWLYELERMHRLDKVSIAEIEGAIEWSQKDSFWRANILSPKKLREKYPTLYLQAQRQRGAAPATQNVSDDAMQRFLERRGEQ